MFTAMLIYWRVAPEKMPSLPKKKKKQFWKGWTWGHDLGTSINGYSLKIWLHENSKPLHPNHL